MPPVNDTSLSPGNGEVEALQRENEALLRELENTYAQLAAVLQVSQDETRIAYAELEEKLVIQEKKLVELAFLGGAVEALLEERDLDHLRRLVLDKICLLVPVDLAVLVLLPGSDSSLQRERDVVRAVTNDRARQEAFESVERRVEQGGRAVWLVPDLEADASAAPLRLRPDANSAACLALRAGGHLLGLLVLNGRLRASFRDDQEPLFGTFAHHAAAALANGLEIRRHRLVIAELLQRHSLPASDLQVAARAALAPVGNRALDTVNRVLGTLDSTWEPPSVAIPAPREKA